MIAKFLLLTSLAAIAYAQIGYDYYYGGPFLPQPYNFGYEIQDKFGVQHRQEVGDGKGLVKGSYGFTDERGINRQVEYVADKLGFRAKVKTNEPGTANQNPAGVLVESALG